MLRCLNLNLNQHLSRGFNAVAAAAVKHQDKTLWMQAMLVKPATESLYHIQIDVSESPEVCASYTRDGQYFQVRIDGLPKRSLLAIASPPSITAEK